MGHRVRVRVRVTGSHDHKVTRQAKSDNGRGHLAGHRVRVTSQLREPEAEVRAGEMTGADGSTAVQRQNLLCDIFLEMKMFRRDVLVFNVLRASANDFSGCNVYHIDAYHVSYLVNYKLIV